MSKDESQGSNVPPGAPPFGLGPLQDVMNDPEIANLAEQVANDPAFKQIQDLLKNAYTQGAAAGEAEGEDDAGGEERATEASASAAPPAALPGMPPGGMPPGGAMDLSQMMSGLNLGDMGGGPGGLNMQQYMSSMQNLMANPQFLQMAEKLGRSIIEKQGPEFQETFQRLGDPGFMDNMKRKMEAMRDDPELKPVLDDLESNGPAAMYKYWNNPQVLAKFREVYEGPENLADVAEGEEGDGEEEDLSQFPLIVAASDGSLEDLTQLLDGGTDPDQADPSGRTALHFAAGYGELPIVQELLKRGAKLDAVDTTNNTPLHYAAGYGQKQCCEELIKKGASKTAKNTDGKTPAEVAELNSQTDVVELLGGKAAS